MAMLGVRQLAFVIGLLFFCAFLPGYTSWHFATPISAYVKSQYQALRRAQRSPKLAIVLLARNSSFYHQDAWEAWAERRGSPSSVSFTIHYDADVDRQKILDDVPSSLADITTVVQNPTECRWMATTPCMYRALQVAFETDPDADFFSFASPCSVPVEPLPSIINQLRANPRSRFHISDVNHKGGYKHHQWAVLTRAHAELLVDNPKMWTDRDCCKSGSAIYANGKRRAAADDEFCPLRALNILSLNSTAQAEDHPMSEDSEYDFEISKELFSEINFGHIPPPPDPEGAFVEMEEGTMTTFVCWHHCHNWGRGRGGPLFYMIVYGDRFESDVLQGHYWFARKFQRDAVVVPSKEEDGISEPLSPWIAKKLREM